MNTDPAKLTLAQAARHLGISKSSLKDQIRLGRISSYKQFGRRYCELAELDRYLAAAKQAGRVTTHPSHDQAAATLASNNNLLHRIETLEHRLHDLETNTPPAAPLRPIPPVGPVLPVRPVRSAA